MSDITFWIVVGLAILGGAVGGAFATWAYLAAEEEQGWRERRREAAQDELWANFYATADDLFGYQHPTHRRGFEAR